MAREKWTQPDMSAPWGSEQGGGVCTPLTQHSGLWWKQHKVFKVYLCCRLCQDFLSF